MNKKIKIIPLILILLISLICTLSFSAALTPQELDQLLQQGAVAERELTQAFQEVTETEFESANLDAAIKQLAVAQASSEEMASVFTILDDTTINLENDKRSALTASYASALNALIEINEIRSDSFKNDLSVMKDGAKKMENFFSQFERTAKQFSFAKWEDDYSDNMDEVETALENIRDFLTELDKWEAKDAKDGRLDGVATGTLWNSDFDVKIDLPDKIRFITATTAGEDKSFGVLDVVTRPLDYLKQLSIVRYVVYGIVIIFLIFVLLFLRRRGKAIKAGRSAPIWPGFKTILFGGLSSIVSAGWTIVIAVGALIWIFRQQVGALLRRGGRGTRDWWRRRRTRRTGGAP